jgi:heme/copper-type cytochrome/quinol oxidase subunit 1
MASLALRAPFTDLPVCSVGKYPVKVPHFEWTLEWMLPSPVPLHQFEQSPVVIEVKDRNPDADALIYKVWRTRKSCLRCFRSLTHCGYTEAHQLRSCSPLSSRR